MKLREIFSLLAILTCVASNAQNLFLDGPSRDIWIGAIEYSEALKLGGNSIDRDISFSWDDKGQLVRELLAKGGQSEGFRKTLVKVLSGSYILFDDKEGDRMEVLAAGDPFTDDNHPFFFLSEKPNLVVGMLPSSAKEIELGKSYELADKTTLERVGSNRDLRTAQVVYTRSYNGQKYGDYFFDGFIRAENGTIVPRNVTIQTTASSGDKYEYEIRRASIGMSLDLDKYDSNWMKEHRAVIDRRVDPAVTWTFEELKEAANGRMDLTLMELLELSKGRANTLKAGLDRGEAIQRQREQAKREARGRLLIIGSSIIGMGFILFLFWKKNKNG